MSISPLIITASSMVNALGRGKKATQDALQQKRSGLQPATNLDFSTWLGRVVGVEDYPLEEALTAFSCRNNQLAKLTLDTDDFREAIQKAKDKYGVDRIGVFLGSSTSGSEETEKAYQNRDENGDLPENYDFKRTDNFSSLLDYTQQSLGLAGVGQVISTACSSSAKVFAAAHRHIEAGFCDAAIVGGVDTITQISTYGFHSLQLTSTEPCRPCDEKRDGISIGEAGGFALLETAESVKSPNGVILKGYGESSDAYHMSTPHPQGRGAADAMRQALDNAELTASDIDYINMHGTATPSNDAAEDNAITSVFGTQTPCSSTKGWTGHTLGAAGITEALICLLVLENQFLPANLNLTTLDPSLSSHILLDNSEHDQLNQPIKYVISNSFGFGGSNCSLIFGLLS